MNPNQLKICAELSCNHVYVPDNREGLCPRCGSEGIWLNRMTENEVSRVQEQDEVFFHAAH